MVPLTEYLGEATKIIDMIVDQSPDGLEVLRGSSTYIYDGNWKLQTENGADGYHVSAVHWNYAATTSRRKEAEQVDNARAMSAGGWAKQGGGFYSFENGHLLLWTNWANPEDRPNWDRREELAKQFGQARADWMVQRSRNLCLYPNVYLMDQFGSQIRHYRPISVDKTEVTIYCIAPKGEAPRRAPAVSGNMKISSMPPGWRRRTIWRSSAPASSRTGLGRRAGTTCRVARRIGSTGPTLAPRRLT